MKNRLDFLDEIEKKIKKKYSKDMKKINALLCLFKTNIDNIENIKSEDDFKIKFKQAEGVQTELLQIINEVKQAFMTN